MRELLGKRVLIIAHGHPDFNKGGAEIAAYRMFLMLRECGIDAYFLARTQLAPHGGAAFSHRGKGENEGREILFHTQMDDGFSYTNIKTRHLWQDFAELLQLIKPDVVHCHHYFLMGIELFQVIRNELPKAKIVLTLHEYLAICHQHGQMIKTNGTLCYEASPRDCHQCFNEYDPGDFLLREHYIKQQFAHVDSFVAPSEFLANRYIEWGLAKEKIAVIENGQYAVKHAIPSVKPQSNRVTLGYFGQLNPVKGIDILLKALALLPDAIREKVHLEIHGANLEHQHGEFKRRLKKLMLPVKHCVSFMGAYEPSEMSQILLHMDWVVVPSTWWENSPMVIQEAFAAKVPLIVSNIGGMAEKVKHQHTGLQFRVASPTALAQTIERVVTEPELQSQLRENITPPLTVEQSLKEHLPLYLD
ncbi:MAG: glycosyl transferase family 1 [Idiomarina sp.]|uniref:glycosyltransferase family 4 protein n=1 Tax=Idiomarina sp. TaxID=1874361 RepID=UPI000C371585|nr:glycosyltransferase family 4 protein [Idiomarina sp.]MBT42251.1 glycosyl transferase family 1 [Idiomarina sp.]